jgi:N6-adenosine-specific RNA methylase IME4
MTGELVPADPNAIAELSIARKALAEADNLPDIAWLVDRAEIMRVAVRKIDAGLDAQNDWAIYKIDAERKAGAMLADTELAKGSPGNQYTGALDRRHDDGGPKTLKQLGLNENQSRRWQKIASLPEADYQAYIAATRAKPNAEITEAEILRLARLHNRPRFEPPTTELNTLGPFDVLYADPPWRMGPVSPSNRAVENHYPTMELDDICALQPPVSDNAVLFLWVVDSLLSESKEVIDAWGFDYRDCMVWVKDKRGLGAYARQQHELLLIAKRGNMPPPQPADRPSSVVAAPRTEHSKKPDGFYDRIETMYPNRRYGELFARRPREGWTSWGNQLVVTP